MQTLAAARARAQRRWPESPPKTARTSLSTSIPAIPPVKAPVPPDQLSRSTPILQKSLPAKLPAAPPASAAALAFRHPDSGAHPPAPPAPPQSLSAKGQAGSHSKQASPPESSALAPLLRSVFQGRKPAGRAGNLVSALQWFLSSPPVYFLPCFPPIDPPAPSPLF